jgi:hypothetical protein
LIREATSYLVVVVLICEVSRPTADFLLFFPSATQIGLQFYHADGVRDRRVGAAVVRQIRDPIAPKVKKKLTC